MKSFVVITTRDIAIDMYRKRKKARLQNKKHYLFKKGVAELLCKLSLYMKGKIRQAISKANE